MPHLRKAFSRISSGNDQTKACLGERSMRSQNVSPWQTARRTPGVVLVGRGGPLAVLVAQRAVLPLQCGRQRALAARPLRAAARLAAAAADRLRPHHRRRPAVCTAPPNARDTSFPRNIRNSLLPDHEPPISPRSPLPVSALHAGAWQAHDSMSPGPHLRQGPHRRRTGARPPLPLLPPRHAATPAAAAGACWGPAPWLAAGRAPAPRR